MPDWLDWSPKPDWTVWGLGDGPGHNGVYVQVHFPWGGRVLLNFDLGPGCAQTRQRGHLPG